MASAQGLNDLDLQTGLGFVQLIEQNAIRFLV